MNDLKDEVQNPALLKVIKDSIADGRDTIQKLAQVFKDNVLQLRMEQTESVLKQLTLSIEDLQNVMEFIEKLREGMQFFKDFGLPADILKKTLRSSDIIARIGGDEFTVLLIDPQSPDIEKIINCKIRNNLTIHNEKMKREYNLSASMGFAHLDPFCPSSIDALLVKADALMYEDKQRQKSDKNATS